MNYHRPRIRPELQRTDRILNILTVILLLVLWIISIYGLLTLPDVIPIHFNLKGEPDSTGQKSTILFLPILGTIIIAGLSYLNKFPHLFNYPSTLNEENASWHYLHATRLIRVMKCSIAIVFILCIFMIIHGAYHKSLPYHGWEIPIIIGIVLLPVIYYLVKAGKHK